MKKFKLGLLLLAFVAALTVVTQIYLHYFSEKVTGLLDAANSYAEQAQFAQAGEEIDALRAQLDRSNHILSLFLSHVSLDELYSSAARLPAYLDEENTNDFFAESAYFSERLKAIVHNESIALANIF